VISVLFISFINCRNIHHGMNLYRVVSLLLISSVNNMFIFEIN